MHPNRWPNRLPSQAWPASRIRLQCPSSDKVLNTGILATNTEATAGAEKNWDESSRNH